MLPSTSFPGSLLFTWERGCVAVYNLAFLSHFSSNRLAFHEYSIKGLNTKVEINVRIDKKKDVLLTQILQGRSDYVENLTRQRHDRDQTENQQNAATVDSCSELVGSRQHGVAQQKVEQPTRVEWSTKCTWELTNIMSQSQ